jgi:hypothetical protein
VGEVRRSKTNWPRKNNSPTNRIITDKRKDFELIAFMTSVLPLGGSPLSSSAQAVAALHMIKAAGKFAMYLIAAQPVVADSRASPAVERVPPEQLVTSELPLAAGDPGQVIKESEHV